VVPLSGARVVQRLAALSIGVVAVAALASACGSDPEPAATSRLLTPNEAGLLAEALFGNFEAGGATFEATALAGPGQGSFSLRGDVDWVDHGGIAEVAGGVGDAPVTAVVWTRDSIGERRPALDGVLEGFVDDGQVPVLTRAPDLETRRLDQVVAVVTGLASSQRDNAQLIAQTEGSAFLRDDTLRGRDVVVLRYGQRSVYWLDRTTGELLRFEGSDASGRYPLVVDLLERGPRQTGLPSSGVPVDVAAVAELYGSLGATSP
jgi:hypothetical protein